MVAQLSFLDIQTPSDLASFLAISYSTLIYYTYRIDPLKKYRSFTIKKRNGTDRTILTPCYPLKLIQQKIHQSLQEIYKPRNSSHGFIQKRSIKTNATLHINRPWIFTLDIEDFFPSITYQRVRGLFKSPPFSFSQDVAQILAHLCCYNKKLPQGAPTSPIISNMICLGLDRDLQKLAKRLRCNYTRYADDITFSPYYSNRFPSGLGFIDDTNTIQLSNEILSIFQRHSFIIHQNKTRFHTKTERQSVTGIIVNKKLNVRRTYIRRIRAMLHYWKLYGLDEAQNRFALMYTPRNPKKQSLSFYDCLLGMISFVGSIRGKNDGIYIRLLNEFLKNENRNPKNILTQEQINETIELEKLKSLLNEMIDTLSKIDRLEERIEITKEHEHQKELKEEQTKRRRHLEKQVAQLGLYTPPYIQIDLDNCNETIKEIDKKLEEFSKKLQNY